MQISQSAADSIVLGHVLTDIGRGDGGDHRGSRRLEAGVHGRHYGGRGRSPDRRLVLGRRNDACNRLCRSLGHSRVDGRTGRRRPRDGASAILRRSILHWGVTSRTCCRGDVGGGGENRQYVERELHLVGNLQGSFRDRAELDD